MATKYKKKQDESTRRVYAALRSAFPDLPNDIDDVVYRYHVGSIRIRVVSESLAGLDIGQRDDAVMKVLKKLPKDVRQDVTMVLAYTPEEVEEWGYMMREFDDPEFGRP